MVFRSEHLPVDHPKVEQPKVNSNLGEEFERWAFPSTELDRAYPLSPETDPPEVREKHEQVARGVLQKIRQHPLTKPIFRFFSLLAAVGTVAGTVMRESEGALSKEIPEVAASLEDPGVRYELKKIVYEELLDRGEVMDEQEGREGKNSWEQEERLEYEQIRDLSGKFEYLHKNQPELVASYRDPQMRIESYEGIVKLMQQEFSHSSLSYEFAYACIDSSAEVFAKMEPGAAKELYKPFSN